MILSRRQILRLGGGAVAALALAASGAAGSEDVVEIVMQGRGDGSKVWFDPVGVLIKSGQTVRWTNRNPGNSHTATAYNPQNFDRPLRMPAGAKAFGRFESAFTATRDRHAAACTNHVSLQSRFPLAG